MQQTVYVDLYFMVNFSMDLLCLMITASLLHRKPRRTRTLLAAALGGAYAAVALLIGLSGALGFLCNALAALLLCAITFHSRKAPLLQTLKCVPILLFSSMTVGGIMTALYTLLNRLDLPLEVLGEESLSVWTLTKR